MSVLETTGRERGHPEVEEDYDETFAELNSRLAERQKNGQEEEEQEEEEEDMLEYSEDPSPSIPVVRQADDVEDEEDEDHEVGRLVSQEEAASRSKYASEEEEEEESETDDDEEDYYQEEDCEEEKEREREANTCQQSNANGEKNHVYENKFSKPVLQLRGTTLTYGEAKLFGLLDKDGKVNVKERASGEDEKKKSKRNKKEVKAVLDALSKKKDTTKITPEAIDEDVAECCFKPKRSKEAKRAMMNPSCGYDFVSRLNDAGDFLQRNSTKKVVSGADDRSESKKEDYEASLDKLQCPKCRKYQSFDEYVEKRRVCGQCQERYVRLNVVNMNSWKQRQEQAEQRKRERLKRIEDEAYADAKFTPKLNLTSKTKAALSLTERTAKLIEEQKAKAAEAKAQAEAEERRRVEKERRQVAVAKASRAAARRQDLDSLKSGDKNKTGAKQSGESAAAAARTWSNKPRKSKKASFNKTENNISAKFEKLLD